MRFLSTTSIVMPLIAATLTTSAAQGPGASALSAAQRQRIDSVALAELRSTGTPGGTLSVIVGDHVAYSRGYGIANVESGAPMSADMVLRLGSTTKMMTSLAVLSLAHRGLLSIDRPIGDIAPAITAPRLRQVTLRQLLSHTAGLLDYTSMAGPHDDAAHAAFIPTLTDTVFFTEAGDILSYSNLGYSIAGYVAGVAAKKSYADVMADEVFKPLGMRRSTLRPIEAMTYPFAQGHARDSAGAMGVLRPAPDDVRYWPAGSVFTTVLDFSRLVIALLNGGRIDGAQAMPAEVVREALTPIVDFPNATGTPSRYGFGLTHVEWHGVPAIEHGGARAGYGSQMRMLPAKRVAAIVLANQSGIALNRTLDAALTEVAPPSGPPIASADGDLTPVPADESARLVGRYQNGRAGGTLELFLQGGTLRARTVSATGSVTELGDVRRADRGRYRIGNSSYAEATGRAGTARYLVSGLRALRWQEPANR